MAGVTATVIAATAAAATTTITATVIAATTATAAAARAPVTAITARFVFAWWACVFQLFTGFLIDNPHRQANLAALIDL
jgi:hypothetical protein